MPQSFASIEQEFLQYTGRIVWCTASTVDSQGRPRSRILHPIFRVVDGLPVGWVVTSKTPVKAAHLAAVPFMACSYWSTEHDTVLVDCRAGWVEDAAGKQQVWDLFMSTPPPLGYDLSGYGEQGPANPLFSPLRLDPWRIQILSGAEFSAGTYTPRMWRMQQ